MKIQVEQLALELTTPFKVSHGTSTVRNNVLVHITDGTHTGVGEAAVVPYYTKSPDPIIDYLRDPALETAIGEDPLLLDDMLSKLPPTPSAPALAAVDIALHDLWGKTLGQPLFRLWGLNPTRSPLSSYTIGMDDDETRYREKLRAALPYPLLKLKLGTGDIHQDIQLVRMAQEETRAQICVDANCAWTAEEALDAIPQLAELDVLFVEQPVDWNDLDGWRALRDGLPEGMPPLIADESVQGVDSVPPLARLVDGINIKLAKCAGLQAARQMINIARAYNMKVMLGCMVESSVAVTAAAQLAPLADYLDLDSMLLIKNDPYQGVAWHRGKLTLPDLPGLGLKRR